jgi:hypothetical protein
VLGGFAIPLTARLSLYGREDRGGVCVLALHVQGTSMGGSSDDSAVERLAELAVSHGLGLVDWCRAHWIEPDDVALLVYMRNLGATRDG